MSWFKIDDAFADHPKVVALQDRGEWKGALALWTLAGSWCSRQLTNGHVPPSVVRRLGCSAEDAAALVSVGLWHEVDGGYQFNDWSRYNPTREDVEARREKNRRKLQQWRDSKRGEAAQHDEDAERNQVTSELLASCNQVTPLVRNQVGNQVGNQVRNPACNPAPDPTRPDPSIKKEISSLRVGPTQVRDPMAPVGQREDVQRLHEAWKRHCDFPRHKLRSVYGGDAALLAEAIDEYGMANCLLVAKYAPDDGMVNGKHDDGKRHDSIRYIFGNNDAFNRILRAAHEREGKSNRRLSGIAAVEAARRL